MQSILILRPIRVKTRNSQIANLSPVHNYDVYLLIFIVKGHLFGIDAVVNFEIYVN